MKVELSVSEIKHLLCALQDANYEYFKYGTRDFTWEDMHDSVVKKLKELISEKLLDQENMKVNDQ